MCQVFHVSRSGYYHWLTRRPSLRHKHDEILKQKILEVYHQGRGYYGSPRIHRCLKKTGYHCSRKRVERLMKELRLRAKHKKKYKATTDSMHKHPVAENLLNREFNVDAPNQRWVSDITYIYTKEGWLYLSTVMDLYSRKIVGWAVEERLTQALVINSFKDGCREPQARFWAASALRSGQSGATRSRLIYCRKATLSIRGNSIVTSADGNVWVRKLTRQCGNPRSLKLGDLLE